MRILRLLLCCIAVLLFALATWGGMMMNYLYLLLMVATGITVIGRLVAIAQKNLYWGIWTRQPGSSRYIRQALFRTAAWIIIGIAVRLAVIPVQFSPAEFRNVNLIIWGCVAALGLMAWFPRKRTGTEWTVTLGILAIVLLYQLGTLYLFPLPAKAQAIEITPPFQREWYVFHGGNSPLMNHHYFAGSQRYALDLLLAEDGPLPLAKEMDLHAYQTLGQTLLAPVNGTVVATENDLPEQEIGQRDVENLAGNYVVIQPTSLSDGVGYILMAHLQQGSLMVTAGDRVQAGQAIAKCGNSGNTSQPHLHIQAMTGEDFLAKDSKPLPLAFQSGTEIHFLKRNDRVAGA